MINRRAFLKIASLLPAIPLAMRLPTVARQAKMERPVITGKLQLGPGGAFLVVGEFTNLSVTNLTSNQVAVWHGTHWGHFSPVD